MDKRVLVVALLFLAGWASAAKLKPGVPRGMLEEGFDKTTEGISLTVRGLSLQDVWNATVRSKINWSRMQVVEYGPSEGDYLRAIQRELWLLR